MRDRSRQRQPQRRRTRRALGRLAGDRIERNMQGAGAKIDGAATADHGVVGLECNACVAGQLPVCGPEGGHDTSVDRRAGRGDRGVAGLLRETPGQHARHLRPAGRARRFVYIELAH